MGASKIEWTEATWNPAIGCRPVSPGCKNCYAQRVAASNARRTAALIAKRPNGGTPRQVTSCELTRSVLHLTEAGDPRPSWNGSAVPVPHRLDEPLRWRRPQRIFVGSMTDLYHDDLDDDFIAAVWGVMAACQHHQFQVLTKRAERMLRWFEWLHARPVTPWEYCHQQALAHDNANRYIERNTRSCHGYGWPLVNVSVGVSAENQAMLNARAPLLQQCPATTRFISAEPLLGPIDARAFLHTTIQPEGTTKRVSASHPSSRMTRGRWFEPIDQLIVGGESGPAARECDVAWIERLVKQCATANVPCFVKQLGSRPLGVNVRHKKGADTSEWPPTLIVRQSISA